MEHVSDTERKNEYFHVGVQTAKDRQQNDLILPVRQG